MKSLVAVALLLLAVASGRAFGQAGAAERLSFLSVGDWGVQNALQARVAASMGRVAEKEDASFIVSTGNNFKGGVAGLNDGAWQAVFEDRFTAASLQRRWYVALGAEDHAGKEEAQLAYSETSPRWYLPARYYSSVIPIPGKGGRLLLVVLDSELLQNAESPVGDKAADAASAKQLSWLRDTLALLAEAAQWIVVVCNRPIVSSVAGAADDTLRAHLQPLMEKYGVSVVFAGHEHVLEHNVVRGVHYVTSGTGAVVDAAHGSGKADFLSAEGGFTLQTIDGKTMTISFLSADGKLLSTATIGASEAADVAAKLEEEAAAAAGEGEAPPASATDASLSNEQATAALAKEMDVAVGDLLRAAGASIEQVHVSAKIAKQALAAADGYLRDAEAKAAHGPAFDRAVARERAREALKVDIGEDPFADLDGFVERVGDTLEEDDAVLRYAGLRLAAGATGGGATGAAGDKQYAALTRSVLKLDEHMRAGADRLAKSRSLYVEAVRESEDQLSRLTAVMARAHVDVQAGQRCVNSSKATIAKQQDVLRQVEADFNSPADIALLADEQRQASDDLARRARLHHRNADSLKHYGRRVAGLKDIVRSIELVALGHAADASDAAALLQTGEQAAATVSLASRSTVAVLGAEEILARLDELKAALDSEAGGMASMAEPVSGSYELFEKQTTARLADLQKQQKKLVEENDALKETIYDDTYKLELAVATQKHCAVELRGANERLLSAGEEVTAVGEHVAKLVHHYHSSAESLDGQVKVEKQLFDALMEKIKQLTKELGRKQAVAAAVRHAAAQLQG